MPNDAAINVFETAGLMDIPNIEQGDKQMKRNKQIQMAIFHYVILAVVAALLLGVAFHFRSLLQQQKKNHSLLSAMSGSQETVNWLWTMDRQYSSFWTQTEPLSGVTMVEV